MRTALQHLAWNGACIARIDAGLARVHGRTTAGAPSGGGPPILRPFPNIADHVVEAVAIGWKQADWRGALPTVAREIFVGKFALPDIGHGRIMRLERIAPG